MSLPKIAFIGTGGTISSLGQDFLDIMDYVRHGVMMHAEDMVARVPELAKVAEVIPVRFRNVPSFDIFFPEWRELVLLCDRLAARSLIWPASSSATAPPLWKKPRGC